MKIRQHPPIEKTISQEPSSSTPSSARATKPVAGFSAGQLLSGRVLSLETGGRVVLDIDGRTVTAYSAVHLQPGEKVEFVVSRGGDTPWLTLKTEGPARQLFRLLATEAIGQIAEKLDPQIMAKFPSLQSLPSSTLASLATLFSGIQAEAAPTLGSFVFSLFAFSPVKSNKISTAFFPQEKELLQLLAHLEKNAPQHVAEAQAIRQFISLQQTFLGFNRLAGDNLLFIAPLFFAGRCGWGEWLVRSDEKAPTKQPRQGAPLRFDFFLHLGNLGETQISMLAGEHNLNGTFFLEDVSKVEYVAARLHELRDRLVGLGFEAPIFNCRIMQQNNQLRLKEILEESSQISNLALIDLTA